MCDLCKALESANPIRATTELWMLGDFNPPACEAAASLVREKGTKSFELVLFSGSWSASNFRKQTDPVTRCITKGSYGTLIVKRDGDRILTEAEFLKTEGPRLLKMPLKEFDKMLAGDGSKIEDGETVQKFSDWPEALDAEADLVEQFGNPIRASVIRHCGSVLREEAVVGA